jgi:hypothetical protein
VYSHYYLRIRTIVINLSTQDIPQNIVARRLISERELAETYDNGWESVNQYREATDLRENNPDMSRAEVARRVSRPSSAVRGWLVENKKPQAVNALNEAQQRGWINIESTSEQFRAVNQLVAWIFSGGGIAERDFSPHFSVDDSVTLSVIDRLLRWANLPYRIDSDRPERGTVIVPSQAASVFGRVLSILDVPIGVKAHEENLGLPDYLASLPEKHQRDFLRVYALNRGRDLHKDNTKGTYLHSLRSETLCEEIKNLIESTTSGTATVGSEKEIWISAKSVRDLAGGEPVRTALATKVAFGSLIPPTERAFASTYREGEIPGGYRYLQLYEQVMEHDNSGFSLVKQIDDLKLSAVQSWNRGSKPYVQNSIEKANELGWITPQAESSIALGLTSLIAWTFARGSIRADTYYPAFSISSPSHRAHFKKIADDLNLAYEIVRENNSNLATEARPSDNSAILGRILYTLGAPLGKKGSNKHFPPAYLYHSSSHARRFIETWCKHYSDNNDERNINIPPRLGKGFADGLEVLMSEQLYWETTRVGDYKLRVIPEEIDQDCSE